MDQVSIETLFTMKLVCLVIVCLIACVSCTPQPTGGLNCTVDTECGGVNAGTCKKVNESEFGTCECPIHLSNIDCNYKKTKWSVVVGLEFLYFIGFGGWGMFAAGRVFTGIFEFFAGLCLHSITFIIIYFYINPNMGGSGNDSPAVCGVFLIFWIFGWIGVGMTLEYLFDGTMTDGNGYPFY